MSYCITGELCFVYLAKLGTKNVYFYIFVYIFANIIEETMLGICFLLLLVLVSAMAERRQQGYTISREILNEEAVDEMAQKSESKTSLREKVKKSVR